METAFDIKETNEQQANVPKRRGTTARASRVARDKKKVQNKAAQRSFREKKEVHLHYLESFVEAVKSTQNDNDDGKQRLLRAHLQLLEDYRRLHESFIKLRQKSQSIGQSALTAADDDSFNEVERAVEKYNDNTTGVQANVELPAHTDSPMDATQSNSLANQPLDTPFAGLEIASGNHPMIDQPGSPNSLVQNFMNVQDISLPGLSTLNNTVNVVNSKSLFADKVEGACKQFLSQISQNTIDWKNLWLNPLEIKDSLASVAIRLISELSGLGTLIYGSDFHRSLQRVLLWRLSNNLESKLGVPEPFEPTPLQYSLMNYPVIIDFIPWASIRDQLILSRHSLDLDVSHLTAQVSIPLKL
ncbi:unnamed protein product [Clonostachys rhizophaga]|uniref:BZIP domain-containing protein n=1 Tax=Clonostachys rhizophaga TaxID=160324 RepID=A0A9N9VL23_9HYPO|nr:unnamed protein product [Clonostachys rhizophaga]